MRRVCQLPARIITKEGVKRGYELEGGEGCLGMLSPGKGMARAFINVLQLW